MSISSGRGCFSSKNLALQSNAFILTEHHLSSYALDASIGLEQIIIDLNLHLQSIGA